MLPLDLPSELAWTVTGHELSSNPTERTISIAPDTSHVPHRVPIRVARFIHAAGPLAEPRD
jgi:hypothetical protein